MILRLSHKQIVTNCETEKAFCISFSRNDLLYLPKKVCSYEEKQISMDGHYWTTEYKVTIPDWFIKKMTMVQRMTIELIQGQWNQEKNS
tara:strand:- start:151 stop:417 length:267 start_codon:yes stop_codon:yes gene_type:complete